MHIRRKFDSYNQIDSNEQLLLVIFQVNKNKIKWVLIYKMYMLFLIIVEGIVILKDTFIKNLLGEETLKNSKRN